MTLFLKEKKDAVIRFITFHHRIDPLFYLLVILAFGAVIVMQNRLPAKLAVLNRLIPPMKPLADALVTAHAPDDRALIDYLRYYQKIVEAFPDKADAQAMTAYCLYYLDQPQQAVNSLKKAVRIHPHFFWFYYNLGMMDYETADFSEAAAAFENALGLKPEISLLYIRLSKIYQDILKSSGDDYSPAQGLQEGYRQVHRYLIFSYYQLKDFATMMQVALVAARQHKNDGEFFYYAGIAAYEQKLPEQAVAFFEQCLRQEPENARAMVYMAAALRDLGKTELAARMIVRARMLNGPETLPPVVPPEHLPLRIF